MTLTHPGMDEAKRKRRGRCAVCKGVFALRRDGTIRGHGVGTRAPYLLNWCDGSTLWPVYVVGDVLASTLNDSVCQVVDAYMEMRPDPLARRGVRQSMQVVKLSGERGHAKVGDVYPESNTQAFLLRPA